MGGRAVREPRWDLVPQFHVASLLKGSPGRKPQQESTSHPRAHRPGVDSLGEPRPGPAMWLCHQLLPEPLRAQHGLTKADSPQYDAVFGTSHTGPVARGPEPQADPVLAAKGFRGVSNKARKRRWCPRREPSFICQPHCLRLGGALNARESKFKDCAALQKAFCLVELQTLHVYQDRMARMAKRLESQLNWQELHGARHRAGF